MTKDIGADLNVMPGALIIVGVCWALLVMWWYGRILMSMRQVVPLQKRGMTDCFHTVLCNVSGI